jgi:hypothetical protein
MKDSDYLDPKSTDYDEKWGEGREKKPEKIKHQ